MDDSENRTVHRCLHLTAEERSQLSLEAIVAKVRSNGLVSEANRWSIHARDLARIRAEGGRSHRKKTAGCRPKKSS